MRVLLRAVALVSLMLSAAVLAWLLFASPAHAATADACAGKLPHDLVVVLQAAYPGGLRTPCRSTARVAAFARTKSSQTVACWFRDGRSFVRSGD